MKKIQKPKNKPDLEEEYTPEEDFLQNPMSDIQQQDLYKQVQKQEPISKKKLLQNKKNDKFQQQIKRQPQQSTLPNTKQLTIAQIKQKILIHTPEMKKQIHVLDDNELRQIYYETIYQTQQQQHKTNYHQTFQESKQSSMNYQSQQPIKNKKRNPQIQKKFDQIIKTVPHMKNQVQEFDDNQIIQLYQSVAPSKSFSTNGNRPTNINEIRKILGERIPQMKGQIVNLSDSDIIDVYEQHVLKDQQIVSNNIQQYNYSPPAPSTKQNHKQPVSHKYPAAPQFLEYDPLKKFQNQSNNIKPEAISNINSQNSQSNWFNNYKHKNNNFINQSTPISKSNGIMPQSNLSYPSNSNSIQIHNFHNNQRVANLPPNAQNCSRTVIIVRYDQPGFIPQISKPKCKCQCCTRKQSQIDSSNILNEFIQSFMPKYSIKR